MPDIFNSLSRREIPIRSLWDFRIPICTSNKLLRFSVVFVSAFQTKQPATTFKIPMLSESEAQKFSSQEKRNFLVKGNLKKSRIFCTDYTITIWWIFLFFIKKIFVKNLFFTGSDSVGSGSPPPRAPGFPSLHEFTGLLTCWTIATAKDCRILQLADSSLQIRAYMSTVRWHNPSCHRRNGSEHVLRTFEIFFPLFCTVCVAERVILKEFTKVLCDVLYGSVLCVWLN